MERVKGWGGGGEEKKETFADKPLDFENLSHAQLFHSVIGCHELTNKILRLLQRKWTLNQEKTVTCLNVRRI